MQSSRRRLEYGMWSGLLHTFVPKGLIASRLRRNEKAFDAWLPCLPRLPVKVQVVFCRPDLMR